MSDQSFLEKMMNKWFGSEPVTSSSSTTSEEDERRRVKREEMTVEVALTTPAGESHKAFARNLSPIGLFIETPLTLNQTDKLTLIFPSADGGNQDVTLIASVVWSTQVEPAGYGLQIEQQETASEALKTYRSMVFHYIRHPPTSED